MAFILEGLDMTKLSMARSGRRMVGTAALGCAVFLVGCDVALRANDPDIVVTATSAAGAIALKNGVIGRLNGATAGIQGPDGIFPFGGLLADEWRLGDTFEQRITMDKRNIVVTNSFLAGPFRDLNRTRVEGRGAIDALRKYSPSPATNIALMFALTAFSEVQIGETFCNGIPFSDVLNGTITFGNPVSVDSAFRRAINSADSALLNNGGVASEVTRMTSLANVVKARAQLNRGLYAAAAATVATVATSFSYTLTFSLGTRDNQNWALGLNAGRYVVANSEGGNGLNFVTAADPRIVTVTLPRGPFDSSIPISWIYTTKWDRSDPVVIASGIEARLIEAEAALQAGDGVTFLAKINTARQTRVDLPNITIDPGTLATRADLLFRERAFWMFGTGHRLGDLRRLIRQYGRGAETVFPTGTFVTGGTYGPDVNMPISFDELNNPNIPQTPATQLQSTCTDRNA